MEMQQNDHSNGKWYHLLHDSTPTIVKVGGLALLGVSLAFGSNLLYYLKEAGSLLRKKREPEKIYWSSEYREAKPLRVVVEQGDDYRVFNTPTFHDDKGNLYMPHDEHFSGTPTTETELTPVRSVQNIHSLEDMLTCSDEERKQAA